MKWSGADLEGEKKAASSEMGAGKCQHVKGHDVCQQGRGSRQSPHQRYAGSCLTSSAQSETASRESPTSEMRA